MAGLLEERHRLGRRRQALLRPPPRDFPPVLVADREAVRRPFPTPSEHPNPESRREFTARLVTALAGMLPVGFIAIAAFGTVTLRQLAVLGLGPVILGIVILTGRSRSAWRLMATAVAVGILATAPYDLFRLALVELEVLDGDPIPNIGAALQLEPAWATGYLWRYVGDGGGLALTFVVLGFRSVRAGILFGLAVCGGLLLTLLVTPHGQDMLFPLNLHTVLMATIGHIVYGSALGALATRRLPPHIRGVALSTA